MAKEICWRSRLPGNAGTTPRAARLYMFGQVLIFSVPLFLAGISAAATTGKAISGAEFCRHSARLAARKTGVPLSVLLAISLAETGRDQDGSFQPWPWTVNMEGKGVWFQSRFNALTFAKKNFDRGARSFDIGCFQINFKWHGEAFRTINQMFEPNANALYAAKYLKQLFLEKGTWDSAAGAYHSRTPIYANAYAKRFSGIRASLLDTDFPSQSETRIFSHKTAQPPANNYPLLRLRPEAVFINGSLVAMSAHPRSKSLIIQGKGRLF